MAGACSEGRAVGERDRHCAPGLRMGTGCFQTGTCPCLHRKQHPSAALSSQTRRPPLWLTPAIADVLTYVFTRAEDIRGGGKTLNSGSNWILFIQDFACPAWCVNFLFTDVFYFKGGLFS